MLIDEWVDDPCRVKEEFRLHFANRFRAPTANKCKFNYTFPNRLSSDQLDMLESPISRDEDLIFVLLWNGFSIIVHFLEDVTLISKNHDPMFVNDYRPISLIGSLYKVVTKILATRLSSIISGLISDVQTAFLPNRQILDGPFIINELLSWCKHKKQQAMVFKVDFAKAYDSIRWDFLEDVLRAFGFCSKWCRGFGVVYTSVWASVLLNGCPTSEFLISVWVEERRSFGPLPFILFMASLHLSLLGPSWRGIFKGIKIGRLLIFPILSYADDDVNAAALYFGCSTMKTPFKYLGVMVGGNSSTLQAYLCKVGFTGSVATRILNFQTCGVLVSVFYVALSSAQEDSLALVLQLAIGYGISSG
ncbi:RNA-directed DNA polymerase, eukaryota [Tanacetum coccineum]